MNWRWLGWRREPERDDVTPDPVPDAELEKRERELQELKARERELVSRVTALEYKVGALTIRVEDLGKGDTGDAAA